MFNTGQPNSNLTYYDGMVKLTYTDGDSYHTTNPINRKTEITFLCDHEQGKGSPEFQDETDHTYSFRWFTSYACPETPVECVVVDEQNNLQYDLSRYVGSWKARFHTSWCAYFHSSWAQFFSYTVTLLWLLPNYICHPVVHRSLSRTGTENNWSTEDSSGSRRKFYFNVCQPLTHVTVDMGCDRFAAACVTEFNGAEVRGLWSFEWPWYWYFISFTISLCLSVLSVVQYVQQKSCRILTFPTFVFVLRYIAQMSVMTVINLLKFTLQTNLYPECIISLLLFPKELVKVGNLGEAKSGPTIDGKGLILEYSDGAQCNGDTHYNLKIHLTCEKGALVSQAKFWLSIILCWACPQPQWHGMAVWYMHCLLLPKMKVSF